MQKIKIINGKLFGMIFHDDEINWFQDFFFEFLISYHYLITIIDVEKCLNYDTFILNKCVPLRASQHLNLYLYHNFLFFFACAYVRNSKEENRSLYLYNFSSTFFVFCYISCCFKSLCQFLYISPGKNFNSFLKFELSFI